MPAVTVSRDSFFGRRGGAYITIWLLPDIHLFRDQFRSIYVITISLPILQGTKAEYRSFSRHRVIHDLGIRGDAADASRLYPLPLLVLVVRLHRLKQPAREASPGLSRLDPLVVVVVLAPRNAARLPRGGIRREVFHRPPFPKCRIDQFLVKVLRVEGVLFFIERIVRGGRARAFKVFSRMFRF